MLLSQSEVNMGQNGTKKALFDTKKSFLKPFGPSKRSLLHPKSEIRNPESNHPAAGDTVRVARYLFRLMGAAVAGYGVRALKVIL